jgi:hypothetical protein
MMFSQVSMTKIRFLPSASGILHLLILFMGSHHHGSIWKWQSSSVSPLLFVAAKDMLNPNTCINQESGVKTKVCKTNEAEEIVSLCGSSWNASWE